MKDIHLLRRALRIAVADYMRSEGCSCCQDRDAHEKHKEILAKLLLVPKYPDGSGYDFSKYRSPTSTITPRKT